jgi:hypothetical protein
MASAERKVVHLLGDLETYVSGQSDITIGYGPTRRGKDPISTAIAESAVAALGRQPYHLQFELVRGGPSCFRFHRHESSSPQSDAYTGIHARGGRKT